MSDLRSANKSPPASPAEVNSSGAGLSSTSNEDTSSPPGNDTEKQQQQQKPISSGQKPENAQTIIHIEGKADTEGNANEAELIIPPTACGAKGNGKSCDENNDIEASAAALLSAGQSGTKVALMSRIIPMSRKSSQVVPEDGSSSIAGGGAGIAGAVLISVDEEDPSPPVERVFVDETGSKSVCLVNAALLRAGVKEGSGVTLGTPPLGGPPVVVAEVKEDTSTESVEEVCRICHDNPSRMTLLSPCLCKGSMGKVHRVCLERWLGESAKTSCEICGHEYETERRPRYTGWRSVVAWIRNPLAPTDTRNLFFDLACFFILTPLAAISAWLCVVGAKHYSFGQTTLNPDGTQELPSVHDDAAKGGMRGSHGGKVIRNKSIEASNSTWTSIGLLTLTGTLLAAYYVWLFVAVRYHIQVWREWQARNFVVTISPLNPERVRQLRQLREATAMVEAAAEQHQHHHQQQQDVTGQTSGRNKGNSNNNNNNNNNNESSDDSSSLNSKPHKAHLKRLREKALARAFEETASIDSTGTIISSDPMAAVTITASASAGPSNVIKSNNNSTRMPNSEVDSIQGKVIVIPSEVSCHIPETTTTRREN